MERNTEDKYKCPKCNSDLVWSLRGVAENISSVLRCQKHPSSTRLDWIPAGEKFCLWEGKVKRKNGKIVFFLSDGVSQLRRRL
tara:strand:+ start:141 stop:389 length:249 start_codon:yes stop_codon:yes gene_type:complete